MLLAAQFVCENTQAFSVTLQIPGENSVKSNLFVGLCSEGNKAYIAGCKVYTHKIVLAKNKQKKN